MECQKSVVVVVCSPPLIDLIKPSTLFQAPHAYHLHHIIKFTKMMTLLWLDNETREKETEEEKLMHKTRRKNGMIAVISVLRYCVNTCGPQSMLCFVDLMTSVRLKIMFRHNSIRFIDTQLYYRNIRPLLL